MIILNVDYCTNFGTNDLKISKCFEKKPFLWKIINLRLKSRKLKLINFEKQNL